MAARLYLDTHAIVWLHQGDLTRFSERGLIALETHVLLYSPAVLLELQFLHEISRLLTRPATIVMELQKEIGLEACPTSYLEIMSAACFEDWTRDPFDRAIVAQARHLKRSALLSRDRKIQEHYDAAFW